MCSGILLCFWNANSSVMVENCDVFLICLTCTMAALRLTGLTLFVIKWIRHNMSNHEEVQSLCRGTQFRCPIIPRHCWPYDSHCGWQITVTRKHGFFFKVAWYCFLCWKLILWATVKVSREKASFNGITETKLTWLLCVCVRCTCMYARVYASPWL